MTGQAQDANANTVPALTELSSQKLLDGLIESDHPVEDFTSIDQPEQRLLFFHIWKEFMRLREVDKEHQRFRRFFPPADKAVFTHDGSRFDDEPGVDPDALKAPFLREWKCSPRTYGGLSGEDMHAVLSSRGKMVSWNAQMDLFRLDDNSGLSVCSCGGIQGRLYGCEKHAFGKECSISRCISSQLLYYRLAAVFGMPPASRGDGYKVCWQVSLQRIGEEKTRLDLYDWKGTASGAFVGTVEASDSALKLLDWLISDKVPHTYDGVLAGCAA